ncbi:response regulator [Cohnella sp. AR92]|uniref:response regulator n=1 Tax=Cohnella sp. AR92 TaxID=648716 RepID=UPI0013158BB1|nr:response regulator [Cohnella sp. AR92]
MLTMLVVDDEIFALKGITQGIDWSDLPFKEILEADNVKQAMKHMEEKPVDLVISDIEMPGANGMELLRWINDRFPNTQVIFLTGHARFDYAREALQLGCFDYALKPIDHEVLKDIVAKAVREIEAQRNRQSFEEMLSAYHRQWTQQLHLLVERFWQDLLADRVSLRQERLEREFELYDIPLKADGLVLPVMVSIEQWNAELNARDESIMEYAIRKAASETILGEWPGAVLQDRSGLNLILLYASPDGPPVDRQALLERCNQYKADCESYFHCRISCYVSQPVPIGEIASAVDRLQQLERTNVSAASAVIDASALAEGGTAGGNGALPNFAEWGQLIDQGGQDELIRQLEETTKRLQDEMASRETLELLHAGLLHLFYQAAHRKGISVYDALTVQELSDPQASRSPQQLLQWASKSAEKFVRVFSDKPRDSSAVIAKINAYIQDNLHRDLSRDDIANEVYRNPAYLSRLFRKETGLSLSEYIAQKRIEEAKRMLVETNLKVSNIAEGLGYQHFSYFAKLFRKFTGLTPQDYRKKYQKL